MFIYSPTDTVPMKPKHRGTFYKNMEIWKFITLDSHDKKAISITSPQSYRVSFLYVISYSNFLKNQSSFHLFIIHSINKSLLLGFYFHWCLGYFNTVSPLGLFPCCRCFCAFFSPCVFQFYHLEILLKILYTFSSCKDMMHLLTSRAYCRGHLVFRGSGGWQGMGKDLRQKEILSYLLFD